MARSCKFLSGEEQPVVFFRPPAVDLPVSPPADPPLRDLIVARDQRFTVFAAGRPEVEPVWLKRWSHSR